MTKKIILLTLLLSWSAVPLFASAAEKIRSGNRHYQKGDYEKALDTYRQAEISAPDHPVVHFNIGDALYKTGDFEASASEFRRSLAGKEAKVKSRAYYNLGNAAYRSEKTDEALEYYKKALELDPDDKDAKYNIEFITAQKSNPAQGKNKKDQEQDKNEKEKSKGRQGREQERKENNAGMSKEDAQRILQVFNEQDRNSAQKRKMALPQMPETDEDW